MNRFKVFGLLVLFVVTQSNAATDFSSELFINTGPGLAVGVDPHSPALSFYRGGRMIWAPGLKPTLAAYREVDAPFLAERIAVIRRFVAIHSGGFWLHAERQNQPSCMLHTSDGTVGLMGDWRDIRADSSTQEWKQIGRNRPPLDAETVAGLRAVIAELQALAAFNPAESRPWAPEQLMLFVSASSRGALSDPGHWPKDWPVVRLPGPEAEESFVRVDLPGTRLMELRALMESREGIRPVIIDGHRCVVFVRFVLPGEKRVGTLIDP